MKVPGTITWGFDPDKSEVPVLRIPQGRLLWGILRSNHIVSQYFNDDCLAFINSFLSRPPTTYAEFSARVGSYQGFAGMGRRVVVNRSYWAGGSRGELDNEYWQGVYNALRGKLVVEQVVRVKGDAHA